MSRARTLFIERIRGRRPLMFTAQRRAEVELLADGDLDMVQRELQAAFNVALDMGEPDPAAQLAAQMSRVRSDQGGFDEAARLASLSLERAPAESVTTQALAHAAMARALAVRNEPQAARFARASTAKAIWVDARRAHELAGEGARGQQRPSTPFNEEPNSTLSDHNG